MPLTLIGDPIVLTHASNAQSVAPTAHSRTLMCSHGSHFHVSLTGTASDASFRVPPNEVFMISVPANATLSVFVAAATTTVWQGVAA
jgi:hypothetical protein